MSFPFEIALFVLLLIMALMIVRSHSLFIAVMLSAIFSLLSTSIYTLLDAVDVAFTEAAVGAGISTVLFLGALSLVGDQEAPARKKPWLAIAVSVSVGAALIYGTLDMPAYGDYAAPIHHHVAPYYITESPREIGLPNFVTSILASYRGYDTFGETTVTFTAAVGVLSLLANGFSRKPTPATTEAEPQANEQLLTAVDEKQNQLPKLSSEFQGASVFPKSRPRSPGQYHTKIQDVPVVRVIAKLITPFILLFALYVQFHGDFGPGGGFQAGVIFAAGFILYAIIFGKPALQAILKPRLIEIGIGAGVLIYGGTGLLGFLRGLNFLDYYALGHHGQHWGIFLVELGVGTTVAAVMVAIFYAFVGRSMTNQ